MQAEQGARFTLRLTSTSPQVVYQLAVELNGPVVHGKATLDLAEGNVAIDAEHELPEWLMNTVKRLLRALWRDRKLNSNAAAWPRRLTRWRRSEQTRDP